MEGVVCLYGVDGTAVVGMGLDLNLIGLGHILLLSTISVSTITISYYDLGYHDQCGKYLANRQQLRESNLSQSYRLAAIYSSTLVRKENTEGIQYINNK